jgi:hypothetical protein
MNTRITAATTAALLAAALTACGSSHDTAAPKKAAPPSATPSAATTTEDPEQKVKEAEQRFNDAVASANTALGETLGVQDGTYEVTENQPDYTDDPMKALDDEYIAPGTYTTKGPADGIYQCYWARLADASGDPSAVITNGLARGRAIVTVNEGEYFQATGCKPWVAQTN